MQSGITPSQQQEMEVKQVIEFSSTRHLILSYNQISFPALFLEWYTLVPLKLIIEI